MGAKKEANDFTREFESLPKGKQKEVIKELMPRLCQLAMEDRTIIDEMMPMCMEMIKGMDFPMKEMVSKMMGRPG